MRKYVVGAIVGAVLMFAGQAAADSISKVGKKVQGEVSVKVDGVTLEAKGLIVDGQTSVPARAFANASGFNVVFENKEVLLTRKGVEQTVHDVPVEEQINQIESEITLLENDLKLKEKRRDRLENGLSEPFTQLETAKQQLSTFTRTDVPEYKKQTDWIAELEQMKSDSEKELVSLNGEIETLRMKIESLVNQRSELEAKQ